MDDEDYDDAATSAGWYVWATGRACVATRLGTRTDEELRAGLCQTLVADSGVELREQLLEQWRRAHAFARRSP